MKFTVLSLFPRIIGAFFDASVMKKAVENSCISYELINIRDFAFDKHKTCDDSPYGGGAGMLMLAEPLATALDEVGAKDKHVVFMSPSGKSFSQEDAKRLSRLGEMVVVCGRYEGVDQRVIDEYVDEEFSIGDYVISSGEVAALVLIDAVYRLVDGVISPESLESESFVDFLLEYPQYTRPSEFRGRGVPPVLLSGHHANIELWRLRKRLEKTLRVRPDLIKKARLAEGWSDLCEGMLEEIINEGYN